MIEGESAEEFDERIEKKELCEIVRAAVDRLPEREAFVIRRLYFDDYTKRALASGGRFKDENEVARIENAAMLKLRRDETLKALHYAHFPDDPQDVFGPFTHAVKCCYSGGKLGRVDRAGGGGIARA